MTNVSLTCRLSKDIQEKAEKFIIDVITTDTIDTLKEKVKESRNDIFFDIEADHLMLWKVQIPNGNVDEFMNLTLRDDESKNIQKLKGIISNFWEEQPSEEFTHVVIDSPYLIGKRKMQELTEQLTRISIQCRDHCTTYVIPDGTRDYLQNLYYAKIIRLNDELCIDKNYKKKIDNESFSKKVYIKCKVVDFNDGILSVTLVDYEKDQKKEILFMEDLELWLLDEFELDGKYRPKDYKNCAENIDIIRDGEWLGSIAECRRKYIKNQLAPKVDKSKVSSVEDDELLKKLIDVSNNFWEEFEKNSLSCVCPVMVDKEPVIVASVYLPEDSIVRFPAKFKGYKVMYNYGVVKSSYRSHHQSLKPGISISDSVGQPDACTLGVLFKLGSSDDRYILTTKHGVGDTGSLVLQPGSLDNGDLTHECAIVSLYNHPGFDTNFHLLDYAFCKISNRNVQAPPNIPFQTQTIITSIKDTVSNSTELFEVQKVGRTTGHTHGKVMDVLVRFFSDLSDHSPVTALAVYGQGFGDGGDSGSPVFDIDGQLWGIYQGNMIGLPISMVIPIHIIINDAFVRFDVAFRLL